MKFALVDYSTEVPVSKYAYTTADSVQKAIDNFRRQRKEDKRLRFPNFLTQYEIGAWKVIQVPEPKPKPRRSIPSFKSYQQTELGI